MNNPSVMVPGPESYIPPETIDQLLGFGMLLMGVIFFVAAYILRHEAWKARHRFFKEIKEYEGDFRLLHLLTFAITIGWTALIGALKKPYWQVYSPESVVWTIWYFPGYHAVGVFIAAIIPTFTAIVWFLIYSSKSTAKGEGSSAGLVRGALLTTLTLVANVATLYGVYHLIILSD